MEGESSTGPRGPNFLLRIGGDLQRRCRVGWGRKPGAVSRWREREGVGRDIVCTYTHPLDGFPNSREMDEGRDDSPENGREVGQSPTYPVATTHGCTPPPVNPGSSPLRALDPVRLTPPLRPTCPRYNHTRTPETWDVPPHADIHSISGWES